MRHYLKAPPRLHQPEAERERHATWLELFFDLVFVVAITQLSDKMSSHLNFTAIFQFIALFVPVVWAWVGHTVYSTRFDTDDVIHRSMTFIIMFAAAIMTVQIPTGLDQGANGFAMGYILARITLLILYTRVLYHIPDVRSMTFLYLIGFGLGVSCWGISIFVAAPSKFWLWALGIAIDFLTPWIGKRQILSKLPVGTSHIPERFGLFTIIVLGECVAAVIIGLTHTRMDWQAIATSLMAFFLATLIWLQYYSYTQIADYKCNLNSGQSFMYIHYPMLLSLVIIGVSVEHTIRASTSPLMFPEKLNLIFCAAVILWLTSFLCLQYISIIKYNLKLILPIYSIAILLILALFLLWPLSPFVKITGLDMIYATLVAFDLYVIKKRQRDLTRL